MIAATASISAEQRRDIDKVLARKKRVCIATNVAGASIAVAFIGAIIMAHAAAQHTSIVTVGAFVTNCVLMLLASKICERLDKERRNCDILIGVIKHRNERPRCDIWR